MIIYKINENRNTEYDLKLNNRVIFFSVKLRKCSVVIEYNFG